MKRNILALGLLSVCCLGLAATESQAWGLLNPCNPYSIWNCHNRYVTQITCRPYNAFTPICWGNLVCDGCCPNPCGMAGGCLPMTMGTPPFPCNGCGPMGCGMPGGGGCCASDMGMGAAPYGPTPMPNPGQGGPSFTPPMPMPVGPNTTMYPQMPMPTGPNMTMMYPPAQGVSQAAYQPYYPTPYYQPTYYNPYMGWQPNPYYWYGYGR